MKDTLHMKAYRLMSILPWLFVAWAGLLHEYTTMLLFTAGVTGYLGRVLVGWQYPPKTLEDLERVDKESVS